MKICKGCEKEFEELSNSGFCSAGICSLKEEGYRLGFRTALNIASAEGKSVYEYGADGGLSYIPSQLLPFQPMFNAQDWSVSKW